MIPVVMLQEGVMTHETAGTVAAGRSLSENRVSRQTVPIDLAGYFARIGYDGPRVATLEVLRDLVAAHVATFPFEAIDVLRGAGVDLTPCALEAKLIFGGRGGYCFEQNGLLRHVLRGLGFAVTGLAARVVWQADADAPLPAPSHMVLQVEAEGESWLVDVGFGSTGPTAPLLFDVATPQITRHDAYRLCRESDAGGVIVVEVETEKGWQAMYRIDPRPVEDRDYEMMNWFTSTHPASHFRRDLSVALATSSARFALRNNRLTIRPLKAPVEQHVFDANELEAALRDIFDLPVDPSWRPMIDRAVVLGNAANTATRQPS